MIGEKLLGDLFLTMRAGLLGERVAGRFWAAARLAFGGWSVGGLVFIEGAITRSDEWSAILALDWQIFDEANEFGFGELEVEAFDGSGSDVRKNPFVRFGSHRPAV